MDVRLPDGTVIKGVPDGTTRADLVAKLQRNGVAVPAEWLQQAPQQQPTLKPADTPGVLDTLLIGAGRTFDRVGKGAQQLYHGAMGNDAALAKLKASAQEDDAAYAPLRAARPWATGIGESLPSMAIPGGGASTLLGNAGRMAAAGAIPGLLEYGTAGERALRGGIGAAAGAAMPLVGAGIKSAWSLAEPLWQGGRNAIAGRAMNRVAGDNAPAVAQRLANASELVPGSLPTAAEVAQSGGIAAMQRAVSGANPEAFAQRGMEQASARVNALRGIAGAGDDLERAIAQRGAEATANYGKAYQSGIDAEMAAALQPQIDALMARPSIQKAISHAKDLAAEGSMKLDDMGSVQGLHYLKMALDDQAVEAAANPTKQRLIKQTAKDLQSVLADIAPEYRQAMGQYASASQPINRMQVGHALLDKLQPALADHGGLGRETASAFGNAMRGGDSLARKATGFPGSTLLGAVGSEGMSTLNAIAADLARKTSAQDLGRGVGSNTFQNFAMDNIAAQSGLPQAVGGLLNLPGISRAASWAYRETDQKVKSALADAMLNPKLAAELMQKADQRWMQQNPALRQALEQAALRPGPGLLGALGAQSQQDR